MVDRHHCLLVVVYVRHLLLLLVVVSFHYSYTALIPSAGTPVTSEGVDKQQVQLKNPPAVDQGLQRPTSQRPSWYNPYCHPYGSGYLPQWSSYHQVAATNLHQERTAVAGAPFQQWQGSPSAVHVSESVVLTQSTEATSTMSASPLTTPLRKSQNGQSMPPDIDPIATPSQDSINPCEVTTPSSPSSPILLTSSRALTELRSSPTSTSDSDTGSEALQGKISNPKRRRSTKSGSVVRKRVRVSQKHPSHGMVEGAMIGNKAFDVPRQQPLRQPEEDKSKANQRFTRQIKDIISRIERLALETSPWLIICAQQPGAGPAIHYESPRLRVEAMEEATTMVTTFQEAIQALNLAKVMDAKSITQDYEKKIKSMEMTNVNLQKEKEAAHLEASKAREDELAIKAELERQKLLVASYEARLEECSAKDSSKTVDIGNA